MKKPCKDATYYFQNEFNFRSSIDNAHFFVMRNYAIGMHKQDFFEINVIVRGSGIHFIEDDYVEAKVGDVFIIPPETEHGYIGGDGFDVFHVTINNKFIQKNSAELQTIDCFSALFNVKPSVRAKLKDPLQISLSYDEFDQIMTMLEKARTDRASSPATPAEVFVKTGTLYILIAKLCTIYANRNASNQKSRNDEDLALMRAISYIHENYGERISISDLAHETHLSKSSFLRKFISVCNMPPNEYIIQKRLEVAITLLKNTDIPLGEIAERVGFYDFSHFSRTFKRLKGITPSEYRKKFSYKATLSKNSE